MGVARAMGHSTICSALLIEHYQMSSAEWLTATPTANLGAVEWGV